MTSETEFFTRLRRWPDVEGPDLLAVDPADRLILDETAAVFPTGDGVEPGQATGAGTVTGTSPQPGDRNALTAPGAVVVLGDLYGALTLGVIEQFGSRGVRAHTDELTGELALGANAERVGLGGDFSSFPTLNGELMRGARVVLIRLPRGLEALTEMVALIAEYAAPDVTVLAGGRLKYMTRAMNDVLAEHFGDVRASLARSKSRVLIARELRSSADVAATATSAGAAPSGEAPAAVAAVESKHAPNRYGAGDFPRGARHDDVGLAVFAHGAAFAGTRLDVGTRFLLAQLGGVDPEARTAVDLGCGTGVLAVALARQNPHLEVIASDQSAAAVASARATAEANDVGDRVRVVREDALAGVADGSVDVVVCNPPSHVGAAVHTGTASKMFRAAARVLRPGGQVWTVFNSHLLHKAELSRVIGRTDQIAKNPKFTVTRSVRRVTPD